MRRVESRRHGVSSGHLTTAGPRGGAPAARPVGAATAASAPAASVGRWSRRTRPGRGRGCRRPRRAGVGRPMARRTVLNVQRPRNHLLRHAFHQMQVADLGPLGRPDRSPPASSRLSRRGGHVSPPSIFARRLLLPGAQGVPFRLAARVPFHVADLGPLGHPDRSPPASSWLSRRGGHVSPRRASSGDRCFPKVLGGSLFDWPRGSLFMSPPPAGARLTPAPPRRTRRPACVPPFSAN